MADEDIEQIEYQSAEEAKTSPTHEVEAVEYVGHKPGLFEKAKDAYSEYQRKRAIEQAAKAAEAPRKPRMVMRPQPQQPPQFQSHPPQQMISQPPHLSFGHTQPQPRRMVAARAPVPPGMMVAGMPGYTPSGPTLSVIGSGSPMFGMGRKGKQTPGLSVFPTGKTSFSLLGKPSKPPRRTARKRR